MAQIDQELDTLIAEAQELLGSADAVAASSVPAAQPMGMRKKIVSVIGKSLLVLLETVLLLVFALYGVMFVLAKGPSPTARDLFVLSVRETSAVGFLANLFFTEEEIAAIEAKNQVTDFEDTDTSLIVIPDNNRPGQFLQ